MCFGPATLASLAAGASAPVGTATVATFGLPAISSTALGAASLGLGAVSTAMQVQAQKASQEAAARQAAFEAAVARRNTVAAENAAKDAIRVAEVEKKDLRRRVRAAQGQQRTAFAGNNVVVDIDTPAQFSEDLAALEAADIATIDRNAEREAARLRLQGQQFATQGTLAELRGSGQPDLTFGTALAGASGLLDRFITLREGGAFGNRRRVRIT